MDMLRAVRSKQAQRRLQAGDLWQDWIDPAKQYAACRLVFRTCSVTICTRSALMHITRRSQPKQARRTPACMICATPSLALSLQNGDDVKTVQENLGHVTAAFTLDVYGSMSSERMNR